MNRSEAEIVREYGPFPGVSRVNGVTFDGKSVWLAAEDKLHALDPETGQTVRAIEAAAEAGTAFDGRFLYQIGKDQIHKIDPSTGAVVSSVPAPGEGWAAGMAWAEGFLWIGDYKGRKIYVVEPDTGKVLREIEASRFVTGVTWMDGELWHGSLEEDESDLRRIDPSSGEVLEVVTMPEGIYVSGLESNGKDTFFCGGAGTGKLRAVRRPNRTKAAT